MKHDFNGLTRSSCYESNKQKDYKLNNKPDLLIFLSDPGVPGVRSMGRDVTHSLTTRLCADLSDVTLADEDSNSIPTDDVNGTIKS